MRKNLSVFIALLLLTNVAYSDSKNVEWIQEFSGKTDRKDLIVKTDSEGFIYLAGTFNTDSARTEWKLIKLSPNSDTLFTRSFNSLEYGNGFLNALEIDTNDNIYLTGSFYYSESLTNFSAIKLNKDGELLWKFTSDPIDGIYEGNFTEVDASSNVYIGGNIINSRTDFFIFYLDVNGEPIWSYSMESLDDKVIKGLKIFEDKIVAAFDIFRNYTWDIGLIGINANSELLFEEYYDGKSNGNDKCNDITVDESYIYLTGYSDNNESKDYVTIKYDSNGEINWYALYDDSGNDDEATGIIKFEDLIVVTGSVLTGESENEHKDIVTIAYDYDGIQVWRQKFNGRDSGDDIAVRVQNNLNNEIVVAGYSWNDETNYDGYLLNYDINGEIIWTHNYNDSISSANFLSDIIIDFLGNIYVTYLTVSTSAINAEIIKINQPDKFIYVLKDHLKTLTVGLLDASADSIVRHYIYESCANAADSLFFITYPALIDSCTANGYNLKEAMNAKISEFFNMPSRDHVGLIFKRLWVMGHRYSPLLIVPHYSHFTQTELEANPKLAYAYEEKDYPIPCLNCEGGSIDKTGTESDVTWGTFLTANPLVYVNGDPSIYITLCSATLDPIKANRCMVCPVTSTGPIQQGPHQNPMNHEIEINLGYNGSTNPTDADGCYEFPIIGSPSYPNPTNYARLMRIGDLPYYSTHYISTVKSVKKVDHPIQDRLYYSHLTGNNSVSDSANWLDGDVLSICQSNTFTNSIGELDQRYALANGIYKLDRPGINQKPVYFAFPYGQGLWFQGGPDMGIFYGVDEIQGNFCPTGHRELSENYFTQQCLFCNTAPKVLDIPIQDLMKYLATTDFNTFNDFWTDCVISIGLRVNSLATPTHLSGIPGLNLHNFAAVNNPAPCTPPGGTPICKFELLPGNEYHYEKYFDNNIEVPPGDSVTLYVKANFKNGKSINECSTVTLMDNSDPQNPQNLTFKNMVAVIRGNIKDYDSQVVNYLIEVYQ